MESKYGMVAARRGTENETRDNLPSALSAVNGAHVVDGLLSHPLLLFRLRRDRLTARHPRCSSLGPWSSE